MALPNHLDLAAPRVFKNATQCLTFRNVVTGTKPLMCQHPGSRGFQASVRPVMAPSRQTAVSDPPSRDVRCLHLRDQSPPSRSLGLSTGSLPVDGAMFKLKVPVPMGWPIREPHPLGGLDPSTVGARGSMAIGL